MRHENENDHLVEAHAAEGCILVNLDKAGTEKPGRNFFCHLENNFVAGGNKNPLIYATAELPVEVF